MSTSYTFQTRVAPWMDATFGPMISGDKTERAHRFIEEALELVQATGTTASEAHQLVDYVFGRPSGETYQEIGGVMVTLAALCLAHALDMHEAGEAELIRVWTKVEQIRAKQAAKPKHSPLPEPIKPFDLDAGSAADIGFKIVEMADRVLVAHKVLAGSQAAWSFEMDDSRFDVVVTVASGAPS